MKKNNKDKTSRKNKTPDKAIGKIMMGILDISLQGRGFVVVEGQEDDIMVQREGLNDGLDGDKVKVEIIKKANNGRLEGRIVEVIEHIQTEFIGRIEVGETFAFLIPDKKTMHTDIYVPLHQLNGAKNGDKVAVKIVKWYDKMDKSPEGEVIEILTAHRENDIAMKEILIEKGFPLHFSKDALKEAENLPNRLPEDEIAKRKDCRDILTITIDPTDAKDFDDAISYRSLKNGNYEVGVHIADVSYYVQPKTHLDTDAYQRATSVYFPDRVLPMLPEHISNFLCSLRPNEDKFAFSIIFQISKDAKVQQFWIGRTVIRSDKRFTYNEAQEIIEGAKSEYSEAITQLYTLSKKIREERFVNGAINFTSKEVRFQLDEEAKPIGITIVENKAANQLIEEWMLLANKTVATYVSKKSVNKREIPFPYRVHDVPNEDKLKVFAAFAARFGYQLNLQTPEAIAASFNKMLDLVADKPEQAVLEQLGIRTMSKALYSTDNIGHYGLGFDNYCHFTSPIRRYPDIMVHRILQECIDGSIKIDKQMEAKSRHCSEQEKKAMDAERMADKYKQVEYMQAHIGEVFDAVVSGVSTIGFWAEIINTKCEGLVPIHELAEWDEFVFSEASYALVGRYHGFKYQIGDSVVVRVVATNIEKLQIDLEYVPDPSLLKKKPKKANKKKDSSNKQIDTKRKKKKS